MDDKRYIRTRNTCYYSLLTMASVFSLPPMLFVTFRDMYHISYTLLGTLVLVNFCTQLFIDLVFTFFSKAFNIRRTLQIMPLLTGFGLLIYAFSPVLFAGHEYAGFVIGTVLFSISAGLSEVLLSPVVAAIPSDNPDRDMSMLHSLYAWGVVSVIAVSTLYLNIFGRENWMYLAMFFAATQFVTCYLFSTSPIPDMNLTSDQASGGTGKAVGLALCTCCIFLGSAAENVMTNWISTYMENALFISKTLGDILGMAVFAILLGTGRTLHAKYGWNIMAVLLIGMIGSTVCYAIAGLCLNTIIAFAACIFTGLFTSMLWPGTLIMMEEKMPNCSVAAYALMAAGGDFGASIAPQLVGYVVDAVSGTGMAADIGKKYGITVEQVGMKSGMLVTMLFPMLGILIVLIIGRYFKHRRQPC